jgi:hypothetical protein
MPCCSCTKTIQHTITRIRIHDFPLVMQLNVEYADSTLRNDLFVPRHLNWLGILYTFSDMVLRDWTEGREHFSGWVLIDDTMYVSDGYGVLESWVPPADRAGKEEGFYLSDALELKSNIRPRRLNYVKVGKGTGDPEGWTEVHIESPVPPAEPVPIPLEGEHDAGEMDIDDVNGCGVTHCFEKPGQLYGVATVHSDSESTNVEEKTDDEEEQPGNKRKRVNDDERTPKRMVMHPCKRRLMRKNLQSAGRHRDKLA